MTQLRLLLGTLMKPSWKALSITPCPLTGEANGDFSLVSKTVDRRTMFGSHGTRLMSSQLWIAIARSIPS